VIDQLPLFTRCKAIAAADEFTRGHVDHNFTAYLTIWAEDIIATATVA
jgi:hypothetical protein